MVEILRKKGNHLMSMEEPNNPQVFHPVTFDDRERAANEAAPVIMERPEWVAEREPVGTPQELVQVWAGGEVAGVTVDEPLAEDEALERARNEQTTGTTTLVDEPVTTPPEHAQATNDPMAEAGTNVATSGGPALG